jgi:hypothetical protein
LTERTLARPAIDRRARHASMPSPVPVDRASGRRQRASIDKSLQSGGGFRVNRAWQVDMSEPRTPTSPSGKLERNCPELFPCFGQTRSPASSDDIDIISARSQTGINVEAKIIGIRSVAPHGVTKSGSRRPLYGPDYRSRFSLSRSFIGLQSMRSRCPPSPACVRFVVCHGLESTRCYRDTSDWLPPSSIHSLNGTLVRVASKPPRRRGTQKCVCSASSLHPHEYSFELAALATAAARRPRCHDAQRLSATFGN